MRAWTLQAMRSRLLAATATEGVLAAWAETWGYALPSVEIGYRVPIGAQGWPFVALDAVRDEIDLRGGFTRVLQVAIAGGVLAGTQDRDGQGAQAAVDALLTAVVTVLADPLVYTRSTAEVLIADTAALTDHLYEHPRYQAELLLSLNNSRGDDG